MQIKFIPFLESKDNLLIKPTPAVQALPEWYKSKSPFLDDKKTTVAYPDGGKNISVKWCNPFGDALGAGYFILLENDVQVSLRNGKQDFTWFRGSSDFISGHTKRQISEQMIPEGYSDEAWKFLNYWGIQTPPGYSTMFTHPFNRTELPFLTLSGVVDTDDYNLPVHFPFLIRKDFEGIIEAGTPIAQVIPFRRDKWQAVFEDFNPEKAMATESKFMRTIHRPYKLGYWKRKEWK